MTRKETIKRLSITLLIAWVAIVPLVSLGAKYTPNVISKGLPFSLSAVWASLSVGQIAGLLFCNRKKWLLPTAAVGFFAPAVATVISGAVVNIIFGLYGWGNTFVRASIFFAVSAGVFGIIVAIFNSKTCARQYTE